MHGGNVFIILYCCNRISWARWFTMKVNILTQGARSWQVQDHGGSIWQRFSCFVILWRKSREGKREQGAEPVASSPFIIRFNPSMRVVSSWSKRDPFGPTSQHYHIGVKFQHTLFWGIFQTTAGNLSSGDLILWELSWHLWYQSKLIIAFTFAQ